MTEMTGAVLPPGAAGSMPTRYDTSPYLVDRPWPLQWQLVVALIGGIVPAAAIAWINGERLGLSAFRRALVLVVGAIGLTAMVVLVYHRAVTLPLTLPGEKFRATQVASLVVGIATFPLLALLQASAIRERARAVGGHGSLWAPGLMAVLFFGVPQRLVVWAVVLLLTLS